MSLKPALFGLAILRAIEVWGSLLAVLAHVNAKPASLTSEAEYDLGFGRFVLDLKARELL